MYFEIFKSGNLIKRGTDIIGGLQWSNELMFVPTMQITLPITYHEYIKGREEMKVFANGKCFYGIVIGLEEDKDAETLDITLNHIIHEWTYRQISVNNAVKAQKVNIIFKGSEVETDGSISISANDFNMLVSEVGELTDAEIMARASAQAWKQNGEKVDVTSVDTSQIDNQAGTYTVTFSTDAVSVKVEVTVKDDPDEADDPPDLSPTINDEASVIDELANIYADTNFAYPGWVITMSDTAKETLIDYVYSRQNKLDALEKTMELTPDLYWRVGFSPQRVLEIGEFGDEKQIIVSKKPTGKVNTRIITEPVIEHEFEKVINIATVYSEKSDTGMSSMTLREIYADPNLQDSLFPVVILKDNVNNERNYSMYVDQYPTLAPNNELEYAVLDVESIAMEGGHVIEGTYAFNDLSPFTPEVDENGNTLEITDQDRIDAAKTAYNATIRKLKAARRRYSIEISCEELPAELNVGDKVRLIYDNSLYIQESCTNYMKKILKYNDWFYVTKIEYDIGVDGAEVDTITLEKFLHDDREASNE